MSARLASTPAALTLLVLTSIAAAQGQAPPPPPAQQIEPETYNPDTSFWSPYLSLEAKPGTDRNVGTIDLMVPFIQDADWMLFADLRGRFDDNQSQEGNFGLGYRRIMDEGGWVFGFNGFFDVASSPNDNTFIQGGIGVEALLKNWRFRANGYIPGSDEERLGESTPSSAIISGTSIRLRSFDAFEKALPGFDVEAGYRLPFEGEQFWVYAGYYHFDDSGYETISGPHLRTEWITHAGDVDFLPTGSQFILGGEFQYDDVRDSQLFGTIALRIPLGYSEGMTDLDDYEDSWRKWAMLARIHRDVDVVTAVKEEETDQPAVDPVTGEAMDVFFVESGAGGGTGVRSDPLGIAEAQALAGRSDVLFLLNDGGDINVSSATGGTLTLQQRQRVVGVGSAGVAVISLADQGAFSLRVGSAAGRPTLTRGPGADVVALASGNVIQGIEVTGGNTGLRGDGLSGLTVSDTLVRNTGNSGIVVADSPNAALDFIGTTITGTGVAGGSVGDGLNLTDNAGATVRVLNLDIETDNGIGLIASNTGTIQQFDTDTTITAAGGAAVDIINTDGQVGTTPGFVFANLASTDSAGQGIRLRDLTSDFTVTGDATVVNSAGAGVVAENFDGEITFRRISVNGATDGIRLAGVAANTGSFTVTGDGNSIGSGGTIQNVTGDGVSITSAPIASINFMTIDATGGDDGVEVTGAGSAATNVTLFSNDILADGQGIDLNANGITDLTAIVVANNINTTGSALDATDDGSGGTLNLAFRGNTVASSTADPITIAGSMPGRVVVTDFANNTVNPSDGGVVITNTLFDADPAVGGIQAVAGGITTIGRPTFRVEGNALALTDVTGTLAFEELNIANNAGTGLILQPTAGGFTLVTGGGEIDTTNGAAINIDSATLNLALDDVSSTNSAGAGIAISNSLTDIAIANVDIANSAANGVALTNNGGAFTLAGGTITNPGGDGVDVTASGANVFTVELNDLTVTGAATHGIDLNANTATGALSATVTNNNLTASGNAFEATTGGNGGTLNLNLGFPPPSANLGNEAGVYVLTNAAADTFNLGGILGQGQTFTGNANGNIENNGNTTSGGPPNTNVTGDITIVAPATIPRP